MNALPLFLLLVCVCASASGYPVRCQTCNPERCVKIEPASCKHGLTLDICRCCQKCGRGPNDPCSPLNECGEGLYCDLNIPSWINVIIRGMIDSPFLSLVLSSLLRPLIIRPLLFIDFGDGNIDH
ncbi:insulin-like growth factor-binding protein 7 isoform X2 [Penaeus japonicus]|uniref:insulin-like growth factor-binding protein 7 isoform X2 n=1 Tax=Penaeus japonicus TaxID=27405 RepID=UPI001C715DC1|nr:insulin-like growth factor-binding protein 7 isoform X2 [Penaeus japonicus]